MFAVHEYTALLKHRMPLCTTVISYKVKNFRKGRHSKFLLEFMVARIFQNGILWHKISEKLTYSRCVVFGVILIYFYSHNTDLKSRHSKIILAELKMMDIIQNSVLLPKLSKTVQVCCHFTIILKYNMNIRSKQTYGQPGTLF